jgi:predicted kinase
MKGKSMRTLNIMVGIPCSGKSYFVEHNKKDNDIVICPDQIREAFFLGEYDRRHNKAVFEIVDSLMRDALEYGTGDIWHDAQNIKAQDRIAYETMAKNRGLNVSIYFTDCDVLQAFGCVQGREKNNKITFEYIENANKSLESATKYEKKECDLFWILGDNVIGRKEEEK